MRLPRAARAIAAVRFRGIAAADARDLQRMLNRTVRVVCEVMQTKAASLRLLDEERDELVIKGHHVGDADRKAVIIEVDGEQGARFEQLRCCLAQQRYNVP